MDTKVSAEALREYLISCRRTLHQMPELHFELPQTTAFVASQLQELSIPYQIVENGGIVARIRGKEGKNAFLLRADMDALPLLEQSGESFASTNGRMHACGHDIHTAMLLGAARLLKEREESLPGTVLLVFQSNEEGIAGMQVLLDHGLLDKDHVGAALALHVLPGHGMDAGTYSCLPGPANASVDEYRIEIRGKGTHGAMPYKGVDPINVGIHICNALAAMMTKEVDGRQVTVLSNDAEPINERASAGSPLAFTDMESKINTRSVEVTKGSLSYVTGLFVAPKEGTLYLGYKSEAEPGAGVAQTQSYYPVGGTSRGPYIQDITFVPNPNFNGKATIRLDMDVALQPLGTPNDGHGVGGSRYAVTMEIDLNQDMTGKDMPDFTLSGECTAFGPDN